MAIDGIEGKQPINNKHTMESLNIKKDSYEASIFNEIDKLDGKEDGYLTDLQYFVYKTRVSIEKNKEEDMKLLEENEKKLEEQMKILEAKMDLIKRFPDASFDNKKQTVTIKSLGIYDFDISTLEGFEYLKIKIVEAESVNRIINNQIKDSFNL